MADASKPQGECEREKTSDISPRQAPGAKSLDTFAFPCRGTITCPACQDATQSPGTLWIRLGVEQHHSRV